MGKIGRFHPFMPYIVLLSTQKTPYIVIYPFVTALKSYGLVVPVSYKHNLKLNNTPEWWNRQTQGT